jgi:hypothetical protein
MVAGKSDLPFRKNSAKCRMQRSLKEPTCTDLVPRIHGELLKLGIDVGQTSDSPVTVVELFFCAIKTASNSGQAIAAGPNWAGRMRGLRSACCG